MAENTSESGEIKVLIVEDDETSLMLLRVFLANENYTILNAENGQTALQVYQENPDIKLILMDLKMPVMDGYEATRKIRESNKNIPIVAQSAYALAGDSQKAIDAGCTDYITKPIKKEVLLSKIKRLLNN